MKNALKTILVTLFVLCLLYAVVPAYAGRDEFPRPSELRSVICSSESVTVSKAKTGEIDTAFDVRSPTNVQELRNLGWQLSALLGFGFHYVGINCRNYAPDYIVPSYDYHGRRGGDPLFPLNISQFRFALHLIIGGEVKDRIISEVFDWTSVRIDTCPTPAAGLAWVNTALRAPHDEAEALRILYSIGIRNDTGIWVNTNPAIGPLGELRAGFPGAFDRTIRVLGCPEAATSTSLVSQKFMAEWNRFFGKNSKGEYYFQYDDIPWANMLKIFSWDHSADLWGAGWRVGRDPDYLYSFFHPANDIYRGYNHPGINHPELNSLLEQLKFTKYPNGTLITDIKELQRICREAQEYIFYLAPYIVNRAAVTPNLFSPDVEDWVDSLGYTADNGWTYALIWFKDGRGLARMCNPGTIGTLNPGTAGSVYEWNILSRIFDGFLDVNPWTKDDVNWAVKGYKMEPWKEPENNIDGFKVTFYIRPGIYWHDGDPFTAEDAKWSWDFLASVKFARYIDAWQYYIKSEVKDTYTVVCYLNVTGFWYLYDIAGTAMMFRQTVWQPFWGNKAAAEAFEPWKVKYDDHVGTTGHGDLKCLVGTGPYVFIEYDEVALVARLMANRPFTIGTWTYTLSYWARNFVREDLTMDGIVDIFDAVVLAGAAGATPGHPRWADGWADIKKDDVVDVFDAVRLSGKAGWITLPS